MKRLSQNAINQEIEETSTMFETKEQIDATQKSIEQARADRDHTWINFKRHEPLSAADLQKLRDAAASVGGRPLTQDEYDITLTGKISDKHVAGY
jgi:hypothetical protein